MVGDQGDNAGVPGASEAEERAINALRVLAIDAVEAAGSGHPGAPMGFATGGYAASFGWERFADVVIGLERFGASAPGQVVVENLGFTPERVADKVSLCLEERKVSRNNHSGGHIYVKAS